MFDMTPPPSTYVLPEAVQSFKVRMQVRERGSTGSTVPHAQRDACPVKQPARRAPHLH